MGDSHFARCLQGGGVWVQGGSVTFDSCTITDNFAPSVRAHACKLPIARMGKLLTRLPRLTLAQLFFTCFALVLAGRRRCLGLEWISELLIVHDHWQHS